MFSLSSLFTVPVSPTGGIVGNIMTVEPEATAWRCVWGSGNKTHSYLGQKSGPGFSREGGMRAVLVAVPDITTPL